MAEDDEEVERLIAEQHARNAKEDAEVDRLVQRLRRLGVHRLARDVSDERFARRMLDAHLHVLAFEAQRHYEQERAEFIERKQLEFSSHYFDKANAYNNVIVTLGYAGFFAVWNFVRDTLTVSDNALVALLLGSSLMVYIVWTLRVMMLGTKSATLVSAALVADGATSEDRIERIKAAQETNGRAAARIQMQWPYFFWYSVFTGFAAGLIVLAAQLFIMFGLDFRLSESLLDVIVDWR